MDQCAVLVLRPLVLLNVRVQVVVPPLAALLADPPGKVLRDRAPVFRADRRHQLLQLLVLLLRPHASVIRSYL